MGKMLNILTDTFLEDHGSDEWGLCADAWSSRGKDGRVVYYGEERGFVLQ